MTDLAPVAALLTRYRPHFADADYAPAACWLAEGCDLERDVLPVLRYWTARKGDIHSVGFFTRRVLAARDRRLARGRERDPGPEARLARAYAFLTRTLGKRYPDRERWLAAWEREHGRGS